MRQAEEILDRQETRVVERDLAEIAGADSVRRDGGVITVSPASVAEMARVLRYTDEHGLAVAPAGGGSKAGWGRAVDATIVLRTSRMDAVKEHVWQDMTCTVEAGASWSAMQSVLSRHGQFVALDPLWPERATVGGVVAVNDSGALRLKYGSLRDLIIGMTIVLADGTIAKSGGKVVKNVAGYDLHKLMTGAFGTLGVIAEVTFRLHSIASQTRSVTIASAEAEPLGELLLRIAGSHLCTHALQMRTCADGFFLDVALATIASVLPEQVLELERMASAPGLSVVDAHGDVWGARQALYDGCDSEGYVVKAVMLPSKIGHFSEVVRKMSGTAVTQAGGIMMASLDEGAGDEILELRRAVEAEHGHLTVLRQPLPAMLPVWGQAPDGLAVMQAIKQRFDPNGILNPGRFLGGL
jgi:glycolate oxidase FAD binding subunit